MLLLTNAHIVSPDEVFRGTLLAENGKIARIDRGVTANPGAVNLEGDYLLPGLIDLHTDALDRHHAPRPGVRWPIASALAAHDAQMASSGITTVFDSLSIGAGGEEEPSFRGRVRAAIGELKEPDAGLLRAQHFLHLRLELPHTDTADAFLEFAGLAVLKLVSLTDHTPGQGQYADVERWRKAFRIPRTPEQAEAWLKVKLELRERYAGPNRDRISVAVKERGLPLASHDDRTLEDVERARQAGVSIAEFPVTVEAAAAAKERGLRVLMGGPNLVLGGSHSGNAAAADVAKGGWLDGLTSDYVPSSMLHGAFLLADGGFPLSAAIATVTSAPASMVNLIDRGDLRTGLRADLVRVRRSSRGLPAAVSVWREGIRVA